MYQTILGSTPNPLNQNLWGHSLGSGEQWVLGIRNWEEGGHLSEKIMETAEIARRLPFGVISGLYTFSWMAPSQFLHDVVRIWKYLLNTQLHELVFCLLLLASVAVTGGRLSVWKVTAEEAASQGGGGYSGPGALPSFWHFVPVAISKETMMFFRLENYNKHYPSKTRLSSCFVGEHFSIASCFCLSVLEPHSATNASVHFPMQKERWEF